MEATKQEEVHEVQMPSFAPCARVTLQAIRKVEYDAASDTSIVECTPVHGRTHQIRLHLQVSLSLSPPIESSGVKSEK